MWTVPVPLRPAGQAFQVICMHMFGDVPLPPVIGVIQGPASAPPAVALPNFCMCCVVTFTKLYDDCGGAVDHISDSYLSGVMYSPCGKDYTLEKQDAERVILCTLATLQGLRAGQVKNWRISMTIVAALLSISVGCYLFGVLYSPWGKDYRIERQAASGAPPPDEVRPCNTSCALISAVLLCLFEQCILSSLKAVAN